MPREQQICEQLASPLLYLFPLEPALSITSVLLPVSNSYLTDSDRKRSTPHSTPPLQLTSLPYSIPLSTQLKTNSAKSTPTPSSTEQSTHTLHSSNASDKSSLSSLSFLSFSFSPFQNTQHDNCVIHPTNNNDALKKRRIILPFPSETNSIPPVILQTKRHNPKQTTH